MAPLDDSSRSDSNDPDDRAAVAHHFEATLKPALADLDPAQKAAAIGGYSRDTGIVPDAALDTLLGLAVTGEAEDRITAARTLTDLFDTDPMVHDRAPPALIDFADLVGALTGSDAIPPDDIIRAGDGLIRDLTPAAQADRPSPGLVLLASFISGDDALAAGQEGVRPNPPRRTPNPAPRKRNQGVRSIPTT